MGPCLMVGHDKVSYHKTWLVSPILTLDSEGIFPTPLLNCASGVIQLLQMSVYVCVCVILVLRARRRCGENYVWWLLPTFRAIWRNVGRANQIQVASIVIWLWIQRMATHSMSWVDAMISKATKLLTIVSSIRIRRLLWSRSRARHAIISSLPRRRISWSALGLSCLARHAIILSLRRRRQWGSHPNTKTSSAKCTLSSDYPSLIALFMWLSAIITFYYGTERWQ